MFGSDNYEANDWFYFVLDSDWHDHHAIYNKWHTRYMYHHSLSIAWLQFILQLTIYPNLLINIH